MNHLADGNGSCGGGGGRLNGEGSLGQFDKKWLREANKGVFGAIFFGFNAPKFFGAIVGALFS
jgi:hypothetical protein